MKTIQFAVYFAVLICAVFYGFSSQKPAQQIEQNEKDAAIENALFARTDFFGANAIVPYPTEQARNRLAEVLQNFPGDSQILLKLAESDENLGRFDQAEQEIKSVKPENLSALADFYGRRAAFEKQAEILEKILQTAPPEKRADAFSNLIYLAKKHDLKKYLAPEFYQKIIAQDEASFSVFFEYIEKLTEEKNYAEALRILDENKAKFPKSKSYFLEKEISILILQEKPAEAEKIYDEAFDPFWTEEESRKFYDFLRDNDRYRAYESELRQKFRQNPGDFQTAIRLIHFKQNEGDEFGDIVQKLENARAAKKIAWQTDELLTISQFLIEAGDGDNASRFLYTLCTDFKIEKQSDLRRKVLYQLFELLSDAGYERLALTKGNLDFYESVAKSDASPGITTGILSLIFSDRNPRGEFESKQATAVKLFNRAAAYRIFQEFRSEYPDAPELAQMYLDIIRLYTNSENLAVASKTLTEFEQKFTGFKDFPDAALKLSDAYITAKQFDKEREIYQKLLDFLGKSDKPKFPLFGSSNNPETTDLTQIKPSVGAYPPNSNYGINLSTPQKDNDYYYDSPKNYTNFLSTERSEILYSDVLSRYVSSLARENKFQEILNLYADESAKYPAEQMLYEQMLQWLGQTNLAEKQFEIYQKALLNFSNKSWKDRFARWLIRNKRTDDFENFSRSLVSTFDDAETQDYLRQFVDGKEINDAESFDGKLFFGLYSLAHQRFPHNIVFVRGLLRYYQKNNMEAEWRNLLAEYYFESPEIRQEFLTNLAKKGEIRSFLKRSEDLSITNEIESLPYKLFRADASVWLSEFEKSIVFYRELNGLYPNNTEFSENFLTISRSFGQNNRNLQLESATFAQNQADNFPADENYRIRAGEIQAELGDYEKARQNWLKIIAQGAGENESYLNTATVFWDYFQFDDALKTINSLREKSKDENLYAFQTGAILEAKNDKRAAISEYVKALDENEIESDKWSAKRRLKQLSKNPDLAKQINSDFEKQRKSAKNAFRMTFNFADMLFQMKRQTEAVNLLLRQTTTEKSTENLLEAKQFFRDLDEPKAIQSTLGRLISVAESPRDSISYRLQLAENFQENYEAEKSAAILADLVKKFPANYGVLKETENFYWDLGKKEKSLEVLQSARNKARGEYLYQFSRKLANRLNALNRTDQAEKILLGLQAENPNDTDVFSELTDIYVRTNRSEALRKTFAATIDALRKQQLEPREFKWQAEALRKKMISAFTRLKDYDSAAEQYIEIINREPENEETLEEAISFAKRYGGAKKLLEYYKKTAAEAFKNYRWNVVLARIYEANYDLPNAVENYKTAIFNQPEMLELYESLGEIYVKMQNYEAALETINKLLELSNEDQKYIKQKVQILEKLGRKTEAEAEKAKLPAENLPKNQTLSEQFTEAQNLKLYETEKAVEKYRQAFENLTQNPFDTDIKSAEIAGFVQTVHSRDSLDSIVEKLWKLREKLILEIEKTDSVKSGKARDNLKTVDSAMIESISTEIKTKSNGNEILALRKDIETRLDSLEKSDSQTSSLLQNLIFRCGFEDLQEKILVKTFENSAGTESQNQNLRVLTAFYQKRNNFGRILEILESDLANKDLEFVRIYSENARFLEDTEKELSALRLIFSKQKADDELTNRYLEILSEKNRGELENLTRNPAMHQLQTINFLLSKKESVLAAEAIKNSAFSNIWKLARTAETSLKFNNFSAENEADFINALQITTIGELVKQKPDAQMQLIGSDWFNFSNQYGRWLFAAAQKEKAENYLAAKIENHPKAADLQFNLGYFYLEQRDFSRALEHFHLASELAPDDKSFLPYIGAAYFQLDEKEKAFEPWSKIIEGENATIENASLYLKTLADFGQIQKARSDVRPILLAELKSLENDSANPESRQNLKEFIRNLSSTFSDEAEKSAFFLEICKESPDDKILPQILIEDSSIGKKDLGDFYKILIERADGFENYEHDYDYVSLLETTWDADEAELLFDSEKDFEIEEPKNERLDWQKKYLDLLLENRDFTASGKLIAEIESSLKGHYPRPVWLRTAKFRVELSQNKAAIVLQKMMKFAGVEVSPNAQKAALPNLERLNAAIEILENENQKDLILSLQEAFFARQLALGQYNSANFIGLARTEFQKSVETDALKILKIMTTFDAEESQAELDSLPLIAKFSNKENLPFEVQNTLNNQESLKLAAEILSEFGFPAEAVSYREKLREISPDDAANNIELARLYANLKTVDEAGKILLEIAANKNFERAVRWQSLIVLAEIGGNNEAFWQKILTENQNLEQRDTEIWRALKAISQFQTGQVEGAINLLQENDFTPELKFLKAIFEKNSGRGEQALATFAKIAESNSELGEIFGFYESEPNYQTINLYLKAGKPRAAVYLANKIGILKTIGQTDFEQNQDIKFKTLEMRARELKFTEIRQMLEKLSTAAETIGDFAQAVEFERARSKLLKTAEETNLSLMRLETLQQKVKEKNADQANSLVLNENFVSDF
ncbi:MAG TPA: tetratricopeptide repeat protein [Pyrinomonadaceae bacterium]|nr:tetratricopeptide repeat protein [Pyrinomonadaceae bacterium]